MASKTSIPAEPHMLEAARRGDEAAFNAIVEPYLREVHAHCYRMLASLDDAEEAVQETLLRAWRGLGGFGGRRLIRPWLYRIATNVCLDVIARRPKRLLSSDRGPAASLDHDPEERLAGPIWLEPYPDERLGIEDGVATPEARYEQREAVELAFIAALEHLPARQRAVLVLRDVLGFSSREVADVLDTTIASVNSALQRARRSIEERLPARSQQATLRSLGDGRIRDLVTAFVDAWDRGDIEAMVSALAEDVTFEMPPFSSRYRGQDAMSAFLPAPPAGRWRLLPARANGQLAFGAYRWDPKTERHRAAVLDVITLCDARIAAITAFATPDVFPRFGLPVGLAPKPGLVTDESHGRIRL